MSPTFPIFNWLRPDVFFGGAEAAAPDRATPEGDCASQDRDFLLELMAEKPEAIQSELGVMAMMAQYPRNF